MKRWRQQPSSQALIASSPDIRPGPPLRLGGKRTAPSRSAIFAAGSGSRPAMLCSAYIPPPAFERADSVLHVHRLEPEVVDGARAGTDASAYPAESSFLPVPLAGLNELLENLPLVCRLACGCRKLSSPENSVPLQISSFAEGEQGSGTREVWAAAD